MFTLFTTHPHKKKKKKKNTRAPGGLRFSGPRAGSGEHRLLETMVVGPFWAFLFGGLFCFFLFILLLNNSYYYLLLFLLFFFYYFCFLGQKKSRPSEGEFIWCLSCFVASSCGQGLEGLFGVRLRWHQSLEGLLSRVGRRFVLDLGTHVVSFLGGWDG